MRLLLRNSILTYFKVKKSNQMNIIFILFFQITKIGIH